MTATGVIDALRSGWRGFRARSVYSQLQVLVVVGYLGIVAGTLAFVLAPRGGGNALGARLVVLPGDPVMGRYFLVENRSRRDWIGVRFAIGEGYELRRDAVLAGEKVTLYLREFTRKEPVKQKRRTVVEDVAAPVTLAVERLRIESGGKATVFRVAPSR